ncbi:MAG: hypothetical protein GQ477_01425 [Nanohaloarchaea archaeon]|nr:hypothetical protein [Candidatus Nanohaloarchaea archaeon]
MVFKNYYGIDLVETKCGQFKIIEIHGLTDGVSFSERAKYSPRFSRIYKYVDILKGMRQNGDKIIYSMDIKSSNNHILPRSLKQFYESIPFGFSHLDWISERIESDKDKQKKIEDFNKTGNSTEIMNDVNYLKKSARQNGVADDFHIGRALKFDNDNMYFQEFNFKDMRYDCKIIPRAKIGLFVNWGDNLYFHPKMLAYSYNGNDKDSFEIINTQTISASLGVTVPKWTPRLLIKYFCNDINLDDIFLNEIYLGMGLSSYNEIEQFVCSLSENDVDLLAVKKPMCTHYGTDVSFLNKDVLDDMIEIEKDIYPQLESVRNRIWLANESGFNFSKNDLVNGAFDWPWINSYGRRVYPFVEMGSYILQEFVDTMPVESFKTGKMHQGVIRAQVVGGQTVAVMYRLPEEEYSKGKFVDMTLKENRTFFERADDDLESRVFDFLSHILTSLEENLKAVPINTVEKVRQNEIKYLFGKSSD